LETALSLEAGDPRLEGTESCVDLFSPVHVAMPSLARHCAVRAST
jgi:hypothetical protein